MHCNVWAKRAGKSSLLEHLKRRLLNRGDCLPVQLSIYQIDHKLNEPKFFYTILKSIANAILDLKDQGEKLPNLVCPSINDLELHPTIRFLEVMSEFSKEMNRFSKSQDDILLCF